MASILINFGFKFVELPRMALIQILKIKFVKLHRMALISVDFGFIFVGLPRMASILNDLKSTLLDLTLILFDFGSKIR